VCTLSTSFDTYSWLSRFPLEMVFRIYDNCLANGIEAIFGYSVMLLKKNEDTLLSLKFDEILTFMNTKLFDCYTVGFLCLSRCDDDMAPVD